MTAQITLGVPSGGDVSRRLRWGHLLGFESKALNPCAHSIFLRHSAFRDLGKARDDMARFHDHPLRNIAANQHSMT